MRSRLALAAAITAAGAALALGFAADADAHTPDAQPGCTGLAVSATQYNDLHVRVAIDGVVLVDDNFHGGYQHTFPWTQTAAHAWSVAITADDWSPYTPGGTQQPCQRSNTTTTATDSTTTTTSTTPPSSSSTTSTTTEPTTSTVSETVPGSSAPSTTAPPTTDNCASHNSATGGCNPDTPPDTCFNIDPATGIGQTFIGFVPCGPGLTTTTTARPIPATPAGGLPATE